MPEAAGASPLAPPTDEVKEDEGDRPACTRCCEPGGETAGLAEDEEGEKLKDDDRIEGVATGGAEGKGLKLADGEVDKAADDVLEGEDAMPVEMPKAEVRDSDLPCVPLL